MKKYIKNIVQERAKRSVRFYEYFHNPEEIIRFQPAISPDEISKPIAVLWNINPWKREIFASYLPDYQTAFVEMGIEPKIVERFAGSYLRQANTIFVTWGLKGKREIKLIADRYNIPLWTCEDGFLRSTNPGALHTTPYSLVFDKTGIYYNGKERSDLEKILHSTNTSSEQEIKHARAGIEIFKAARLTKYFDIIHDRHPKYELETDKSAALIVGQMEDDASIKHGHSSYINQLLSYRYTNGKLLKYSIATFYKDKLIYKPHPETAQRKRKKQPKVAKQYRIDTLEPTHNTINILEQVDHVITQTSLVGMEAIIYGKEVYTRGFPFYAGWGLTHDKYKSIRRNQKLTLEQLFLGAYLIYPTYIHPISHEKCTFFELASYFIVEKLQYAGQSGVLNSGIELKTLMENESLLSIPARLYLHTQNTDNQNGKIHYNNLIKLAGVEDFPQISQYMIDNHEYDELREYTNSCIMDLNSTINKKAAGHHLLTNLLAQIAVNQENMNGRVVDDIADFSKILVQKYKENKLYAQAIIEYVRVLSNNLLYDKISIVVNEIQKEEKSIHTSSGFAPHGLLSKLISILKARPSRSERDHAARTRLIEFVTNLFQEQLDKKYTSKIDLVINAACVAAVKGDPHSIKLTFEMIKSISLVEGYGSSIQSLVLFGSAYNRRQDIANIVRLLIRERQPEALLVFAEDDNAQQKLDEDQLKLSFELKTDYLSSKGLYQELISMHLNSRNQLPISSRSMFQYAKALRATGDLAHAKSILETQYRNVMSLRQRHALKSELRKVEFLLEASSIISSYPQPQYPKGVAFLASQNCFNTLAMMAPAIVELKKKGYAFVNLMAGMTKPEMTGFDFIDQFHGIIPATLTSEDWHNEWVVNWPSRRVEAKRINFYQGFYERLSTQSRSYWVDINERQINKDFLVNLKRSDLALHVSRKILNEISSRGINACVFSGNSHVTPFSIFRDFARHADHPHLNFINCNVAYESYYSNLKHKTATTMSVTDMTFHKLRRAPFLAIPEEFNSWYSHNASNKEFLDRAKNHISANRNTSDKLTSEEDEVVAEIKLKAAGRKIVCIFGKVPVDLAVPHDGGPAHVDMADWLNHTVEIVKSNPGIFLVVKPHPHELKPEIALDLVTPFRSLIKSDLSENIVVLEPRDVNVNALAPILDLAVLYNGSSILELTALRVPVIVTSYFGRHDYPLDLIYPASKEEYQKLICQKVNPRPAMETAKRAAFLISYMETNDVSIKNEYSLRQLTNDKIGVPIWNRTKINNFLRSGDFQMETIARRMVEKFELHDHENQSLG